MEYVPGMFAPVSSMADLAAASGIDEKVLALVDVSGKDKCNSKSCDCPFYANDRNGGLCPFHAKRFYPKAGHRGCNLRGPDFCADTMKKRLGHAGNMPTCCCDVGDCFANGYCPIGYITIPNRGEGYDTILGTPGLLSSKVKKELQDNYGSGKGTGKKLALWHFFPNHRREMADGKWELILNLPTYKDKEEKRQYAYPPPRARPSDYCDNEHKTYVHPRHRWAEVDMLPRWVMDVKIADRKEAEKVTETRAVAPTSKKRKSPSSSPTKVGTKSSLWEARALCEYQRANEEERLKDLCMARVKELEAENQSLKGDKNRNEKQIQWLNVKIEGLEKEIEEANAKVAELQHVIKQASAKKGGPLRYDDLRPGNLLGKRVGSFTYFETFDSCDKFLTMINYVDPESDGKLTEGGGLCENVRRYSKVTQEERTGAKPPPYLGADEYAKHQRRSLPAKKRRAREEDGDILSFRDECFVYFVYACTGLTMSAVGGLFGIKSDSFVSDVIHAWAQILDNALCEMFPTPSQDQILRAFPDRLLRVDGDARCHMLIDAFEIYSEDPSLAAAHASMRSDYKGHTTVKFLGGTDPIGVSWKGSVPDGFPGGGSDNYLSQQTGILKEIAYGRRGKVDKGFTCNNAAAKEGVILDRPMKKMKQQKQQSAEDTALTQKVATPRIVVENVNGQMKVSTRYLNALVPVTMFGVVSQIVRIGYLMQNFKLAIVQHRGPDEPDPPGGRPSRAEVRYYGATDIGLTDLRPYVHLWGTNTEIARHKELSQLHPLKNTLEISKMVLAEDIPSRLREQHYEIRRRREQALARDNSN